METIELYKKKVGRAQAKTVGYVLASAIGGSILSVYVNSFFFVPTIIVMVLSGIKGTEDMLKAADELEKIKKASHYDLRTTS
jgi:hypothetical protein